MAQPAPPQHKRRSSDRDGAPLPDRRRPTPHSARITGANPGRRWSDTVPGPVPEGTAAVPVANRDGLLKRALAYADTISAGLALLLGVSALGDDLLTVFGCIGLLLVVLVSKLSGLYDRDENRLRKSTLEEAPVVFQAATLYALLIWLGEGALVDGELVPAQVLALWGLLFVCMLGGRSIARFAVRRASAAERCLVLGDVGAADWVRGKLAKSVAIKAEVVGRVPLDGRDAEDGEVPRLGTMDRIGLVLVEHDIDRVVIAPSTVDPDEMLNAIRFGKSLGVRVSVLPRLFEVVGSAVETDEVDGATLLGIRRQGLSRSSLVLKRAMDAVGSLVLLVALGPLMLTIAAAIRLDSPGPALFRQPRSGRRGSVFNVIKFRTMVVDAEAQKEKLQALNEAGDGLFKMTHDPRITRVGRFLRKTSLDELPQLMNVLKGDMSLVGPRPLVIDEDRRIKGWSRVRSDFTPGMTGPWQVLGSTRIPLNEMVKIDYLYGANWSLWQDVKILLRTIPVVVARRGL